MIKSIRLRVNSFIAYRNGKLGGFTKLLLCLCVPVLLGAAVPLAERLRFRPGKAHGGFEAKVRSRPSPAPPENLCSQPCRCACWRWRGWLFWPSVSLADNTHYVALLPDGRVLSYGTDQMGNQGAQMIYDVLDPKTGTHA